MNKIELKFIISYLKKAIFNLERANSYDDAIEQENIDYIKQALFYYQLQLQKKQEEE